MIIHINNPEQRELTGAIGYVYPFDWVEAICVTVRPGCVDIEGSAMFTPDQAIIFADAIRKAAEVAINGRDSEV
jgi:hypothetical protein